MAELKTNRLIHEKSPYLLQHAHNPVDWYPWGPEAFEEARKHDKPLLISIGYSTCHWCHVMERESFEKEDIAQLMNQYFVSIKVDREERPDIDKIYMTAVSALTGQGGWPLNAFVTPDLKPFFGGTYFPPEARWNHPAWKDLLRHIGEAWKLPEERKKMLDAADHITTTLKTYVEQSAKPMPMSLQWLTGGWQSLQNTFDSARGGFSPAPKFPMPVYHHFLLRYWARTQKQEALDMSLFTLRAMARGGIYDPLGGGFSRYSTDAEWHVPHFEKMLYDNAQLAVNYLEAYQITRDDEFRRVARETLDYVARDLRSPEGAFFSAEDADSLPTADAQEKTEGAFYVWEKNEIVNLLGPEAGELLAFRYGVRPDGNAMSDPHGEFKNKNILYQAHPIPEVARKFNLTSEETTRRLEEFHQRLLTHRNGRPRPHRDDKVLSAWNGLMISAFAKGYQVLGSQNDLENAQSAALFIEKHLYDKGQRRLYRRWREGQKFALGIADDYAFVIQGLLDLYESDFDVHWLSLANELKTIMIERFYDKGKGGFYMTSADQDPHLLMRFVEDQDNVEPSASSIGILNLLRLAQYLDKGEYRDLAIQTLEVFGNTLQESPRALPAMLTALDFALQEPRQIVISGPKNDPLTQSFLQVVRSQFFPNQVVMVSESGKKNTLQPFLESMASAHGKVTAYLCERFVCKQPMTDPQDLARELRAPR